MFVFVFAPFLQEELDIVVTEWNLHNINAARNSICPKGRPFIMYHIPEVYGTKDYLNCVLKEDIDTCKPFCYFINKNIPCDKDVYNLAVLIMGDHNVTLPVNSAEAVELYRFLRRELLLIL